MSSPALIQIRDSDDLLVQLYVHYDGHPRVTGIRLQKLLTGRTLYGMSEYYPNTFNGVGCLAAWLVGELKYGWGNVYIASTALDWDVRWQFILYPDHLNRINMCVKTLVQAGEYATLWRGFIEDFDINALFEEEVAP